MSILHVLYYCCLLMEILFSEETFLSLWFLLRTYFKYDSLRNPPEGEKLVMTDKVNYEGYTLRKLVEQYQTDIIQT